MKVEKAKKIEDGWHTGVITAIMYRHEPFEYIDYEIENEGMSLKAGYPAKMMEMSKLGLLLKRFNVLVVEGLDVDPSCIVGKACDFLTMKSAGKKGGVYANIIADSVKPSAGIVPGNSTTAIHIVKPK